MGTARIYHSATLLPNGNILVAGGFVSSGAAASGNTANAQLYDPAANLWRPTGSLITSRRRHSATLLANGKLLIAGGSAGGPTQGVSIASSELYEPSPAATLTKLEQWRLTWYGNVVNAGNGADNASSFGTKIPNLAVFAFLGPGQNPALAQAGQLPQPVSGGGSVFYNFVPPPEVEGITYGAEFRPTLLQESWVPIPDTGTAPVRNFSLPITPGSKGFVRLKVTGS